MQISTNKFRNLLLTVFFCLFGMVGFAQTAAPAGDFDNIETALNKTLTGDIFLRAGNAPPSRVQKIKISEDGEITLTGIKKDCVVTMILKNDAQITKKENTVRIYQVDPAISISFYTNNADIVYAAFEELKKILN